MSYYDFNEHFWSPEEVCGQAISNDRNLKTGRILRISRIFVACYLSASKIARKIFP